MFGSLRSFILAMAITGLVLAMTHYGAYRTGKKVVEADWAIERAEVAEKVAAAERRARDAEHAMQAAADQTEKAKRDEISRVSDRFRTIIDGLRKRPQRPAVETPAPAGDAESQPVCTGAGLSREDAEFLAGEATRANELRAELQACYQQYDKARELTNE